MDDYQWYKIVEGDEIQQGDILENCPVFVLPPEVELDSPTISNKLYEMPFQASDVIVMSQTCDMVKGRHKISEVLLCSIWSKSDFNTGDTMSSNKD